MEAARRVDDHNVDATGPCRAQRVERDGCRVGAGPVRHDVNVQPPAPHLQLIDRGGAKGVGGAEQHAAAILPEGAGELGDAGGLAHAVHADHDQGQRRLLGHHRLRGAVGMKQQGDLLLEQIEGFRGVRNGVLPDPRAQPVEDLLGGRDAHVAEDERLLQFVPEVVVDAGAPEQRRHLAEPRAAGLREGRFRPLLVLLFVSAE